MFMRTAGSAAAAALLLVAGAALPGRHTADATPSCIEKSGAATGITRDFAEYESLLIIRQVTGNWPIETDRIVAAKSNCRPDGSMWTCVTRAKVCKG